MIMESHSVRDVYHHVGLYFHDHGKLFSVGCVPSCGTLFPRLWSHSVQDVPHHLCHSEGLYFVMIIELFLILFP